VRLQATPGDGGGGGGGWQGVTPPLAAEPKDVARHHAPEMPITSDRPPLSCGAAQPRPATRTTARGALNLYGNSSDEGDIPIANQQRLHSSTGHQPK
jgi:hypothetical protein